jgi:hypothetical protein
LKAIEEAISMVKPVVMYSLEALGLELVVNVVGNSIVGLVLGLASSDHDVESLTRGDSKGKVNHGKHTGKLKH